MDFENLSAHEKKQMVTLIEEKQVCRRTNV